MHIKISCTTNRDNDFSDATWSRLEDTVDESVFSFSHELRYFWSAGDRWTGTTGLYYFQEDDQLYGIRNRTNRRTTPLQSADPGYHRLVTAMLVYKEAGM